MTEDVLGDSERVNIIIGSVSSDLVLQLGYAGEERIERR